MNDPNFEEVYGGMAGGMGTINGSDGTTNGTDGTTTNGAGDGTTDGTSSTFIPYNPSKIFEEDSSANKTSAMWLRFLVVLGPVIGALRHQQRVAHVHEEIGKRCAGMGLALPIKESLVLLDEVGYRRGGILLG